MAKRYRRAEKKTKTQPRLVFGRPEERQRWLKLYGESNRFRHFMKPAYNKAVTPALAGAIGFMQKPKIHVLVVGGGRGVFSKDLLPDLQTELQRQGIQTKFQIVETDISAMVQHAPRASTPVMADFERLPFANNSFDLIVGQATIHQGDLTRSIPELKRVLSAQGIFFHVQDDIPMGYSPVQAERPHTQLRGKHEQISGIEMSQRAHENLIQAIFQTARTNALFSACVPVDADVLVPITQFGNLAGKNVDKANFVRYNFGLVGLNNDPLVPAGKRKLQYSGLITILSKAHIRPMTEYLERIKLPR